MSKLFQIDKSYIDVDGPPEGTRVGVTQVWGDVKMESVIKSLTSED